MSTLYNRYLQLKQEKCDVYYLFKYGIFYIFLDDDAKDISKLFNFKLTNLNASVVKCGFPASQLNKYLAYFRGSNISVKIIESTQSPVLSDYTYVYYKKCDNLIENIAKIDVNIIVEYGSRIPDVAFEIQNRVKKAVESMTGLKVEEVNVHVQGVNTDTAKNDTPNESENNIEE